MSSSDKVLKVSEAKSKDAGRGIARVDPAVMEALGLNAGDVVQIEGKKKTVALVRSEERRVGKECRSRWAGYD